MDSKIYKDLQEYKRVNVPKKRICELLKISGYTLRKIWDMTEGEMEDYFTNQGLVIESYRDFIMEILETTPTITNLNIYYKVLEAFPESGISEANFQKYMKRLRAETGYDRFIKKSTTIRDEPIPGEETQVDFGEQNMKDMYGKRRKVYFMVMVLRYSQLKYVYFQSTPFNAMNAIETHKLGFRFFGGMTKYFVYDQDTLFCKNENYGNVQLEKDFEEFLKANNIGFIFCGGYHPESKGTVENYVKIVKENFLLGRTYCGINSLNSACLEWLDNTENNHYLVDKQATPHELFMKEAGKLIKVDPGNMLFKVKPLHKVRRNAIYFKYAYYEVPLGYEGKYVLVECDGVNIIIKDQDTKVVLATHRYTCERGARVKLHSHDLPEGAAEYYIKHFFRDNLIALKFLEIFKEKMPRYYLKGCRKINVFARIYNEDELDPAFKYCIDHDRVNILDLGTYLYIKHGEEKAKKALGGNFYYYRKHASTMNLA